jgi:recombination protein RecA
MSPELDSVYQNLKTIIDKQHGKGIFTKLTDDSCLYKPEDIIPTGSIALDYALGIGGYRKGRIIELLGNEASGKTSLCLHAIANVQKEGGICAFLDAEHALDPTYCRSLGIDFEKMFLAQPDYGEQALDIVDVIIKDGNTDLVVVDSVAALIPKAELEGEMEDHNIGLQARMMSKAMRKIAGTAYKTNTTVIFVNQLRANIGGMGMGKVGAGGSALKFYSSQRLEISRIGTAGGGSKFDSKGNVTRAKIIKNKLSPPFKTADFTLTFGLGVDRVEEIITLGIEDKLIKKGGAWITYGVHKMQGMDNAKEFFAENPDVLDELEKEIRANRGLD